MTAKKSAIKHGKLYTVAAPSGVGKTSLVKALVTATDNLQVSISYTTRPQRANEVDQVNYQFIGQETFKKMIAADDFLEYAMVFHHYYGTSKSWVKEQLATGKNVILEIDWQGVRQVKQLFPDCIRIFILPPSLATLKKRLEARAQDSAAVLKQRIDAGKAEISHYHEADFLVVNDDFNLALAELRDIIVVAERATNGNLAAKRQLAEDLLAENVDQC